MLLVRKGKKMGVEKNKKIEFNGKVKENELQRIWRTE